MSLFLLQSIQMSYIVLLAILLLPSDCCGCFITDCFNTTYKKHYISEDATGDNNAVTQAIYASTYPPTPIANEYEMATKLTFLGIPTVFSRKNGL